MDVGQARQSKEMMVEALEDDGKKPMSNPISIACKNKISLCINKNWLVERSLKI